MANLSTQNIGTNFKGILNLGATINTPLSTTLQAITDGDGVASPLQLATNRIALGTATGTSLLNFPDAGTTAADGISFGTGITNLYRFSATQLKTDGQFTAQILNTPYVLNGTYLNLGAGTFLMSDNSGASFGHRLALTPATLTGSSATSALSIAQTLNTTGSPRIIQTNITNTASGATTRHIECNTGGSAVFSVALNGNTTIAGTTSILYRTTDGVLQYSPSLTFESVTSSGSIGVFGGAGSGIVRISGGGGVMLGSTVANPSASAVVEVNSTTKGFLPPRMTTTQRDAIASPATGLMIYNTSTNRPNFYDGSAWQAL